MSVGLRGQLEQKIRDRTAAVGVIGLGYVGLALAIEMANVGFQVTGIDIDGEKVNSLDAGISYIPDVPSERIFQLITNQRIRATQSLAAVEKLDAVSICVPTPLRKTKNPDLSYVIAAVEAVHSHLRVGQLIILESTTYPGATRELVLPILQRSGFKAGEDFFLACSPERLDPSNQKYNTQNTPKVMGGITQVCTELATLFYQQFIQSIVPVSSSEVAEMVKFLENTFRSVNVGLANEAALMCQKLAINVWEVIAAAETKPFGFMPFYPGPGLGGNHVGVDPYYLTWKANLDGFEPRLVEVAGEINSQMPAFTISRIADALNDGRKSLKGSKVLVVGVTYKRDAIDVRESPALDVIGGLSAKGALVYYADPFIPSLTVSDRVWESTDVSPEILQSMDCVVVLTDHSSFDYETIVAHSLIIVDCRNVLRNFARPNIYSL